MIYCKRENTYWDRERLTDNFFLEEFPHKPWIMEVSFMYPYTFRPTKLLKIKWVDLRVIILPLNEKFFMALIHSNIDDFFDLALIRFAEHFRRGEVLWRRQQYKSSALQSAYLRSEIR